MKSVKSRDSCPLDNYYTIVWPLQGKKKKTRKHHLSNISKNQRILVKDPPQNPLRGVTNSIFVWLKAPQKIYNRGYLRNIIWLNHWSSLNPLRTPVLLQYNLLIFAGHAPHLVQPCKNLHQQINSTCKEQRH
jgi:hypothetical protein